MINNIKTFGKFLDQPILISKLNKAMPVILSSAVGVYGLKNLHDTYESNKNKTAPERKEAQIKYIKNMFILSMSLASALIAPKIASKITKRAPLENIEQVREKNKKIINDFILQNKNNLNPQATEILEKAKEKILSFNEVKSLIDKLKFSNNEGFVNKLIPDPENIKAKDIFSEIGYLSIYGAIPVIGGIASGAVADIASGNDIKKTLPDKLNEGLYQYLANIFMCNIGAGIALGALEKMNITSKSARAIGMISGIILTGVIGGSKIANFVAKKIISPLTKSETKERKPELMDLGMHTDDIATVAVLSGLKWIEPSLPTLYALSGYKAGVGYRN